MWRVGMIRVVAICVFRDGNRILVTEGVDPVKGDRYARPLGGGVEVGERSAEAVVREVREEIGAEVEGLRLLGVLENVFTLAGRPGHEVVFVYEGRFMDGGLYEFEEIEMREAGWATPAVWRGVGSFGEGCRLVPEGLAGLLER
jgi:ADP-ribose pyrophosphatase YjhB (NUDIX family)